MAKVIVRNIEDDAKAHLTQRANLRGWSKKVCLAQQRHPVWSPLWHGVVGIGIAQKNPARTLWTTSVRWSVKSCAVVRFACYQPYRPIGIRPPRSDAPWIWEINSSLVLYSCGALPWLRATCGILAILAEKPFANWIARHGPLPGLSVAVVIQ